MATIIVPASGATVSGVTFNDTLQVATGTNLSNPVFYEVDGASTLQSLYIGYDIEVDIGYSASGSLTGTGTITGPTDPSGGNLPLVDNYDTLDINGIIGTALSNDGQLTVSSGETTDLQGDLFSLGTITVAAGGQLDLDDPTSALIAQIDIEGRLKSATTSAMLEQTTNNGTIDVAAGTLAITSGYDLTGTGTVTVESGAKFDMSAAAAVASTIVLNAGSTLTLSPNTSFTGTLQSPAGDVTIDVADATATSATVANGVLSITTSAGTISLDETGLPVGLYTTNASSFLLLSTGATGTGSAPGQSTAAVYRFFDSTYGTHLFTQSSAEAQQILATRPDLTQETNNFGAVPASDPSAEPVYRFFETTNGTHFFTASHAEFLSLTTPGTSSYRADLTYESSSTIYEDSTQQSGDVAVYRLFDTAHGTQFLTGSQTEYAGLTTPGSSTYRADLTPEGIAFYAPSGTYHT